MKCKECQKNGQLIHQILKMFEDRPEIQELRLDDRNLEMRCVSEWWMKIQSREKHEKLRELHAIRDSLLSKKEQLDDL